MRTKKRREPQEIKSFLPIFADRDDVKSWVARCRVTVQEALGFLHVRGHRLDLRLLERVTEFTSKNKYLEEEVRRKKVLELEWTCVCCAHEFVWRDTFTEDETTS